VVEKLLGLVGGIGTGLKIEKVKDVRLKAEMYQT